MELVIAAVLGDYTRMNGVSVKMIVDVAGVEYGVAFEHMKSGRNIVQSAFVLEDKGWIRPKQKKSSQTVANTPRPKSSRLGNSLNEIRENLDDIVNSKKEDNQGNFFWDAQVKEKKPRKIPRYKCGPTRAIQMITHPLILI